MRVPPILREIVMSPWVKHDTADLVNGKEASLIYMLKIDVPTCETAEIARGNP